MFKKFLTIFVSLFLVVSCSTISDVTNDSPKALEKKCLKSVNAARGTLNEVYRTSLDLYEADVIDKEEYRDVIEIASKARKPLREAEALCSVGDHSYEQPIGKVNTLLNKAEGKVNSNG